MPTFATFIGLNMADHKQIRERNAYLHQKRPFLRSSLALPARASVCPRKEALRWIGHCNIVACSRYKSMIKTKAPKEELYLFLLLFPIITSLLVPTWCVAGIYVS